MRKNHLVAMSCALVLALSATGFAEAQGPQRGERGGGMWYEHGPGWGMGMWGRWGRGPDVMLERVEGRLAFMKAELKITEAQTTVWNGFADAVRAAAKQHNERMKAILAGDDRSKSLPDRVEAQEQFMGARLEQIKQIKASLKSLYAILSDDQKKEADDMVIPMVGMMGGPGS
jgi:LTXXQ motif family protein